MKFPSLFDIYTPREFLPRLTAHDNERTSQTAIANSWCKQQKKTFIHELHIMR